jgi:hypothetical protein
MKIDYSKQEYIVSNRTGFTLSEALSLWKAKYADFKDLKKDMITHESLQDFGNFIEEMWDSIKPATVQEALAKENAEERRVYFDCIGVQELFKQLEPTLRDRQVIKKKRTKWNDKNDPYQYEFEDVYELYEIDGRKMFETDRWGRTPNPVFAVRCWCTTTNREYWLYVDSQAATGERWFTPGDEVTYDAIRAIAWTIRVDVAEEQIERLYRQGDIIVVKLNDVPQVPLPIGFFRHLSKETYLEKMYSET